MYSLIVTYKHNGSFDWRQDREFEKVIGSRAHASGYDLKTGERDLLWDYRRKAYADKAAVKVKEKYPELKVSVTEI